MISKTAKVIMAGAIPDIRSPIPDIRSPIPDIRSPIPDIRSSPFQTDADMLYCFAKDALSKIRAPAGAAENGRETAA